MSISAGGSIVELNVGGHVFSTTRDTLEAAGDSFFSSMISGDFGVHTDSAGRPFIDRDPKLFRHVLNYLRSQCTNLAIENENKSKLAALAAEAEFFQVSPLIDELQMRVAALNRSEAAAFEREAAERRCRERSRGREASRGRQLSRHNSARSGSATPTGDGETLSQATTIDDYESAGEGDQAETHTTPLSQGRYEEAAHANLISQAASNMDSDF